MIIFVGGLIGSGRISLAASAATRLGYHFYTRIGELDRLLTISGTNNIAITDNERLRIFNRIANDLPLFTKMYDGLVITAPFHRAKPREYLFDAGRALGGTCTIWVDSPNGEAIVNNVQMGGRTLGLAALSRVRQAMKDEFEPFDPPVPVFINGGLSEDIQDRFYLFVRSHMMTAPH